MRDILSATLGGQILNQAEASDALQQILSGEVPNAQVSAFLTTIQMRGLHLSELRGFHQTMNANAIQIDLQTVDLIDVCGTGGDGKNTFNISTLTAFVLAGAGLKVAKHGNFSATSGCGSSDVLQFLGVELTNDESVLRVNLHEANFCYLHAPLFQPKLKTIAALRKEIGFRTFFNLLGTLLNPAHPTFQLIGVAEPFVMRLYRYFLEDSACKFALVNSRDGYDEISLTSAFDVISNNGAETFYPDDLGFSTVEEIDLNGGENVEQAARQFIKILRGDGTNAQNAVVYANAMFALRLVKSDLSFSECREIAEKSLQSGAAFRAFTTVCQN